MPELDGFVRAAKANGASDSFLVDLLRQRGWPEKSVYDALARYYAESTGVPLPEPQRSLESAREAFYHLLAFGSLGTWTVAIGAIWFSMIENWFPDTVMSGWRIRDVSWRIASVLIAFPVFLFATRQILKDLQANPERSASGVRRWLTNIALLIAAMIVIGDLVSFVAVFLQGEITPRFLLKSLVVLLLAGAVFGYYTRGITATESSPGITWHRRFAVGAVVAIVTTLGIGFWETGSPARQRELAMDRRRVADLTAIARNLHYRWVGSKEEAKVLPRTLDPLNENMPIPLSLSDPVTKRPYLYRPQSVSRYSLCATFQQASGPAQPPNRVVWEHPAGEYCFALDAAMSPDR